MRAPSARVLSNNVDIYLSTLAQDADGSYLPTYPTVASMFDVACSVQPQGVEEVFDDQERLTQEYIYEVYFGTMNPGVNPRDKLVWVDFSGVPHTLFVRPSRDNAGRGSVFTVYAVERL